MRIDRTALPYLPARRCIGIALVAFACASAWLAIPAVLAEPSSASARNLVRSVKAAFVSKFVG